MIDPFWLSMGIPIEDSPTVVNHVTSTSGTFWATISSSIMVVIGMFYKMYRVYKDDCINSNE